MPNKEKEYKNKLGIEREASRLEKGLGKWVIMKFGKEEIQGKIKSVNGTKVCFNPYNALRYGGAHKCNLHTFLEEDYEIPEPEHYNLDVTNKETISFIMEDQNKRLLHQRYKSIFF